MIFISINFVSANDNVTSDLDLNNVILDTSDDVLMGKNLTYSATLMSKNNTPLTNETVVFSVNGINYTKITDMNGIAFLNITLDDGIYPISTTFKNQDNRQIVNNNTIHVSKNVGTLIKDNLSGSEIQKIIDGANSGDTLIFAGNRYDDVSLTVNKSLNIISIVKSIFNGNSASPVITVKSDNVNISNFEISRGSVGILLDNADNVKISNNNIINNHDGINVINSQDAWIFNNNISNSKKNAIYLKNSNNANMSYNNLVNNYNGIYFDENVVESQIFSNYISKSTNDAVSFAKSGSNTNMSYNLIENNANGIFIDMVGDENLNIELNTIQKNKENGIYFGENYRKSDESGVINIANNSIVYNKEFNILGRDSIYNKIDLNTNWIASDNSRFNGVCEKIKFSKYHLNVEQIDGNTISVSVDGIKADSILRVSYNGGKNWQTVTLVDGKATMAISNNDGNVVFDYYETNDNYQYQLDNYVPPSPVTPVVPDAPQNPSDSKQTNETNSQSEQVEGNGSTSNPNSGSPQGQSVSNTGNSNPVEGASSQTSESPSSQTASQAVSTASDSQSVSKQVSDPTQSISKALNIDEEVVRIAGMGFIFLLIVLVIAVYYKDDVKYMLNKRNGQ